MFLFLSSSFLVLSSSVVLVSLLLSTSCSSSVVCLTSGPRSPYLLLLLTFSFSSALFLQHWWPGRVEQLILNVEQNPGELCDEKSEVECNVSSDSVNKLRCSRDGLTKTSST